MASRAAALNSLMLDLHSVAGNKAVGAFLATGGSFGRPPGVVIQREVSRVENDSKEKSAVLDALEEWEKASKALPEEPSDQIPVFRTAPYFRSELKSMKIAFEAKWGARERYVIVHQPGSIDLLAKLDDRSALTLSHVVARPRGKGESRTGPSPMTELMTWIDDAAKRDYAGQQLGSSRKRMLNVEVLSLIPIYHHYGYKMQDPTLEARVKELIATTPRDEQAAAFDKLGVDKPVMVKGD